MRTQNLNKRKVVFAAMSKGNFYLREYIIKYILEQGWTPMCAFMMYSYFLLGTVDRKKLLDANNELIRRLNSLNPEPEERKGYWERGWIKLFNCEECWIC